MRKTYQLTAKITQLVQNKLNRPFGKLILCYLVILGFAFAFIILTPQLENVIFTGGCNEHQSKFLHHYYNDQRQISFCTNGDRDQLTIRSTFFTISNENVNFIYSGYPSKPGISLYIETESGIKHTLSLPDSQENWQSTSIKLPIPFQGQKIRFVASDQSTEFGGWIGITIAPDLVSIVRGLSKILIAVSLINLVLASILAMLIDYFRLSIAILLLPIALGAFGYLAFIGYFINLPLGIAITLCLLFLILFYAISQFPKDPKHFLTAHQTLFVCAIYTALIIVAGYFPYYEAFWEVFTTAAFRWNQLPIDNWLQKILADQIWQESLKSPMLGDWLSSDRPPLQTGIYLFFYPASPNSGLLYQCVSTYLQTLIFLPILVLLQQLKFNHSISWVVIAFGFSSLIIINTLFVWPKLFSAVYLFNVYLILMTPLGQSLTPRLAKAIIGSSTALALLCHGGAFFALVGIALMALIRNFKQALMFGLPAGILAFVIYLPWLLYQKLIDPPGNRLVKWHLAGMVEPNNLSLSNAFHNAYQGLTWETWFQTRLANLHVIFFEGWMRFFHHTYKAINTLDIQPFINEFQSFSFFNMFISLWFFCPFIAILIYAVSSFFMPKRIETDAIWLLFTVLAGLIIWALLMYSPASTLNHQGPYFFWIGFFVFSAYVFHCLSKRLLIIICTINSLTGICWFLFDNIQWPLPSELYPYFINILMLSSVFIFACYIANKSVLKNF